MSAPTSTAAPAARRLRVLVVTRMFPNRVEPHACPFQRQQLAALSRRCSVQVLAVIPYLPGASLLGDVRVRRLRDVPQADVIDDIPVVHPRAPYIPRAGGLLAPVNVPLYLSGLLPHLPALRNCFDVVLGAFLYPDACAAALLAELLGLPYVVKGHGTDVNTLAQWRSLSGILRRTLRSAGAVVGVSQPIVDRLITLGARPERTMLVRNGVDAGLFHPGDRLEARRSLRLPQTGKIVLFVGRLEEPKGVRELVAAFRTLRADCRHEDLHLILAGDGSLYGELSHHASTERGMILAGLCPLPKVASYLRAADVLALPSWAEGIPNVILEAFSTGRPVVATHVGGIPDVIREGLTGLLVAPRDVPALTRALDAALQHSWDEWEITRSAPPSWQQSAAELRSALELAVREPVAGSPRSRRRALGRLVHIA